MITSGMYTIMNNKPVLCSYKIKNIKRINNIATITITDTIIEHDTFRVDVNADNTNINCNYKLATKITSDSFSYESIGDDILLIDDNGTAVNEYGDFAGVSKILANGNIYTVVSVQETISNSVVCYTMEYMHDISLGKTNQTPNTFFSNNTMIADNTTFVNLSTMQIVDYETSHEVAVEIVVDGIGTGEFYPREFKPGFNTQFYFFKHSPIGQAIYAYITNGMINKISV